MLDYLRKIDEIVKKSKVLESLQDGGKQKFVSILVKDLEI